MLKVTLYAILLIVKLHIVAKDASHVIHWVVEFPVYLLFLDRKELADEKYTIEPSFDFIDIRRSLFHIGHISANRLAKGKAL